MHILCINSYFILVLSFYNYLSILYCISLINLFYIRCSIFYLSVILSLTAFYLIIVIDFMFLFLCKVLRDEVGSAI